MTYNSQHTHIVHVLMRSAFAVSYHWLERKRGEGGLLRATPRPRPCVGAGGGRWVTVAHVCQPEIGKIFEADGGPEMVQERLQAFIMAR
jgi:hypothetical protein